MKDELLWSRLVSGDVANVRFSDFQRLVEAFGFELNRVNGSHHIYRHSSSGARLNLQNVGGKAKPYQVRQFLRAVERYNLRRDQKDRDE